MRTISLLIIGVCLVSGCAGIHVQALSPNGASTAGQPGLRYYMPLPYLLVTEVPASRVQDKNAIDVAAPGTAGAAKKPPAVDAKAPADDKPADKSAESSAATSPPSGTDAGYQHQVNEYQIKLIYLPDLSRPMAITATAGIGSVSMQPTLVDGWMLTSLQGSADSKVAETLTAVASIITAQKASAGGGGGGGSDTKKAGAGPPRILPPGLYALEYGDGGILAQVCAVTLFGAASKPNDSGINKCTGSKASGWGGVPSSQ